MIIREATLDDVAHVLRHMSGQNRHELETCGLTREQFAFRLASYMSGGRTFAGVIDDRPQWFLSVASENGVAATMFAATEEFFARGAMHIRVGRRLLRTLRAEYGPLYSLSTLPHPDTRRWFKLLGYNAQERPDGCVLFIWE